MNLMKEVAHFNEKSGFTSTGEQKAAITPRRAVYSAEPLHYACTNPATTLCSDILLLKMLLAKPFRRPNGHI